jgi:hypothetical protein
VSNPQGIGNTHATASKSVDAQPASSLPLAGEKLVPIDWPAKIDAAQLRRGVRDAIDYLVRTTSEEGKFRYIVNTDPAVPQTDEYNVVRHAGTMYGLGMYLARYDDEAGSIKAALVRQGNFLRKQMQEVPGEKGMLAIWSEPSVTGLSEPRNAQLGSAALGLIGLTSLELAAPGSVPREELQSVARFILYMQRDDGGFYRAYFPDHGGRIKAEPLLFYPGESALALVLLYELDGDQRWLEAAAQAAAWMAQQRDEQGRPRMDHWMLLATSRLWPHYEKTSQPAPRETIMQFALDLCERLMEPSPVRLDDPRIAGCLTRDGLTCNTATRVEGLMAGAVLLPPDQPVLRAKVQRVCEDAIVFLLRSQVAEGEYRGGIPYAMFRVSDDHPLAKRGYNRLAGEVRIDYVHHAISGMMLYDDVFLRDKK